MLFSATRSGAHFIVVAAILCAISFIFFALFFDTSTVYSLRRRPHIPNNPHKIDQRTHPINDLILESGNTLHSLLAKESHNLEAATKAYRERRGRLPPPGFDKWFEFAKTNAAVIVEDFFDQIYDDLNPFWGVEAKILRNQAKAFEFSVSVRNHNATLKTDARERPWPKPWFDMVSTIAQFLPDVDMPFNPMDEVRVVVPWEDIMDLMEKGERSRRIPSTSEVVVDYSGLADVDSGEVEAFNPEWIGKGPIWDIARLACPPDSSSREEETVKDFSGRPPLPKSFPANSYKGYVQNWTLAKDPCSIPNIQSLHGTFIEPISMNMTKSLFPIFGGSKLPINNEILIPPAIYWSKDVQYTGGDTHGGDWEKKADKLMWRGAASGGRNRAENWKHFQRHRFVAMVNGTAVRHAEKYPEGAPNIEVLPYYKYKIESTKSAGHGDLGAWLESFTDAAFFDLLCHPHPEKDSLRCSYTDPYFAITKRIEMSKMYNSKYLPDVDGNSYSGRYWGFLLSTSLPIKATIYKEWHDSRLVAWQHFVPMDNSFADIYGILDYLRGPFGAADGPDGKHHDEVAKKIALDGKEWAEKVLRHEDMQIYVFRLLLEFARICDDKRDVLGYLGE